MPKQKHERKFPSGRPLLEILMAVVQELSEEQLKKGCTIELIPPKEEGGMVVARVNWNS